MEWNYDESVAQVKVMVLKWSTLTVDLVEKLYQARNALSKVGRPLIGANAPIKTWGGYIQDVGLTKSTANRWLERYIPEEHKLLTVEELEDRKAQEERARREEQKSAYQKSIDRVARYRKTGIKSKCTFCRYRR